MPVRKHAQVMFQQLLSQLGESPKKINFISFATLYYQRIKDRIFMQRNTKEECRENKEKKHRTHAGYYSH